MADIPGTDGADELHGSPADDSITGAAGNDNIDGAGGSDTIDAGDGADAVLWTADPGATGDHSVIHGGTGDEGFDTDPYSLNGGDTLSLNGEGGVDLSFSTSEAGTATDAYGNSVTFDGFERIRTGDGADSIDASGATSVRIHEWNNQPVGIRLHSGGGDDTITGSHSTDYISTGDGNDIVHAGDGNDVVETGSGDDLVHGEAGDDGIRWGGPNNEAAIGNDTFYGGAGHNTLNAWQTTWAGDGVNMVLTGAGEGTVDAVGVQGHLEFHEFQNLLTGSGNDTIDLRGAGSAGAQVSANWGNDSIIGSAGSDTIEGGWGADTIEGGAGDDAISMASEGYRLGDAQPDDAGDSLILRDGFGRDTVMAFSLGDRLDDQGNPLPRDLLDVSGVHDADGNPVTVDDVAVRADQDQWGNHFAVVSFPNGEELWFAGVDPASLTREQLVAMGVPCFCAGTLIRTLRGEVAVEDLRLGDMVLTRDNGPRPIRWLGSRALDRVDLALAPRLRPIRIRAGALGDGLPVCDLMVSPQHRVLVRSAIARRMFGAAEVLVAARQLTALDGIDEVAVDSVRYFHFLFDRHEIVFSNGAETESLYTGPQALKALGQAAQDEIFALFPELRQAPADPARPVVTGARARQMVQRHLRNGRDLVQGGGSTSA